MAGPRGRPAARCRGRSNLAHDSVAPSTADHDARRRSWPAGSASRRSATSSTASRRATRTTTTRCSTTGDLVFGPPVLRPPSLRDFYAFEGHVRTMWERRGGEVPEAWYRLPDLLLQQRLGDPRAGRPGLGAGRVARAGLRARGGRPRRHARDRPDAGARRGGDRRLHDLQRLVGARPPARGDGRPPRAGQGQGLRELIRAVARHAGRAGRRAARRPASTSR